MKINKEDFTYTTDYLWCMEVVVLFRTTTEGCVELMSACEISIPIQVA